MNGVEASISALHTAGVAARRNSQRLFEPIQKLVGVIPHGWVEHTFRVIVAWIGKHRAFGINTEGVSVASIPEPACAA
jgi:hypothetical protein